MTDGAMDTMRTDWCIREISKGDRDALRILYDRYKTPVFRFALSMVKNYQAAEDIMQDTFVNILTYAPSYRQGTNANAWIYTIARNLCRRALMSRDRDCGNIDDFEESLQSTDEAEDLFSVIESLKALSLLGHDELEIVSLYVFGRLRQTEIAKVMKLPYMTVRSKYGYAMKKLKTYYKERKAVE